MRVVDMKKMKCWLDSVSTSAVNFSQDQLRQENATPGVMEVISKLASEEPGFHYEYVWLRRADGSAFTASEVKLMGELRAYDKIVSRVVISTDRLVAVVRSTIRPNRLAFADEVYAHFAEQGYDTDCTGDGGLDDFLGTRRPR